MVKVKKIKEVSKEPLVNVKSKSITKKGKTKNTNIKIGKVKSTLNSHEKLKSAVKSGKKLKSTITNKFGKTQNEDKFCNFTKMFNIKIEDVESAVKGVIKLHSSNPKLENVLFGEESFPINFQFSCHRIPSGKPKILRIPVPHTLLKPEDEVCLIVSEVKGIGNKEHEKHIEHYEKLLEDKGVTGIKKIMTMHEFKTEYETYEQKSRLVDLYDIFLVCGKISGKVVKKCGKPFYQKRKIPTAVKLQATKLKEHINSQLSKVYLFLHLKGNSYNLDFGHNLMNTQQLVENFVSIVDFLSKEFPGGFDNIKGIHLKSPRSTSIPVYISLKKPSDIPKAKVKFSNQFIQKTVTGELSTQSKDVIVKPSGQVILKKKRKAEDNEEADEKNPVEQIKNKKKKVNEDKEENVEKNDEDNKENKDFKDNKNNKKVKKSKNTNVEDIKVSKKKVKDKAGEENKKKVSEKSKESTNRTKDNNCEKGKKEKVTEERKEHKKKTKVTNGEKSEAKVKVKESKQNKKKVTVSKKKKLDLKKK